MSFGEHVFAGTTFADDSDVSRPFDGGWPIIHFNDTLLKFPLRINVGSDFGLNINMWQDHLLNMNRLSDFGLNINTQHDNSLNINKELDFSSRR